MTQTTKNTTVIKPLTPTEKLQEEEDASREKYAHRVLVALDQFANVLCGGDPDETISSRSARAAEAGKTWGIAICKFLNVFQRNHGPRVQASDTERAGKVIDEEANSGGFTST